MLKLIGTEMSQTVGKNLAVYAERKTEFATALVIAASAVIAKLHIIMHMMKNFSGAE